MEQPRAPTSVQPVWQNEDVMAYKLRDDLWLLQTAQGIPVSIYVLEGNEKALVVDSGNAIKHFKEDLKKITDKPLILALTHGHIDHVGSIDEFDTLYINPRDKPMIPDYKGTVIDLNPGFVFDLGGRQVEVIEMYGHTPGHIGLLDKKGKLLITGDAIGHTICWMHYTNLPLESLAGVLKYLITIKDQFTEIYTGHFNQANRPLHIDYVEDLLELVEKIIRGEDVKPEALDWPQMDFKPLLAHGKNGCGVIYNPRRIHYV